MRKKTTNNYISYFFHERIGGNAEELKCLVRATKIIKDAANREGGFNY